MQTTSTTYLLGRFVFELDRAADQLLQAHVGISYRRFLFLTVLQHHDTVTQHQLAAALGYSDPAVSTMLVELAEDGYLQVARSPVHGRKHLVTITAQGSGVVAQGRQLLDAHFDQLLTLAGVEAQELHLITGRLYQALMDKRRRRTHDHEPCAPDGNHVVVSQDGATISYLSMGSGPAVVVIPGALSTAADYVDFGNALAEHFTVHIIERRGRGLSSPQGDDYSISKECEDLLALQRQTGASLLVGHSFGGLVALETARPTPPSPR